MIVIHYSVWHCIESPVLLQRVLFWWPCSSWWLAVLSRVALGSSNTRCLLYLKVCLYATLEMFQITFTQVWTFQLLCPALPNPLQQISSVSIALTPLKDISLQRKETQQFHQWGLLVTMVKYFLLPGRLHSKTLEDWSNPLSFQCQVWMFKWIKSVI